MGWNANTTKQLLTRSGTIVGSLFTLPLISMLVLPLGLLGFPSELSNNSPQESVPQLWKGQQTMAKAKCLFYASLFEPHSQDSYKTQSGSLYEFLLSVQLGLTSVWDDTHCRKWHNSICTLAGIASASLVQQSTKILITTLRILMP